MDWDQLFAATNAAALLGWLALAALPRREAVLAGVLWAGVALLCAVYAAVFAGLFGGWLAPARDAAGPAAPFEYTVDGLKTLFAGRGAIVLGWTHYLAFDLFVGLWIARDADGRGVHRLAQLPFLFATLMAGPIGLLGWLLLRRALARRSPA
jgi:hypothetical protein